LSSTSSKLYANTLNRYGESALEEEQWGFRQGRSTSDAIFILQQILEERRDSKSPTFILFVDYEKAYDNINREKLWQILMEEDI
jgi:sorting nexin-29